MTPQKSILLGLISMTCIGTLPTLGVAAPTGGNIASGTGSIVPVGNQTNIQQDTANMVINWQSFNIQSGEQVNFNQPSASAIALNRDFSGVASEIFGDLNANGQVYLFNTAGILIGPTANINVSGLFLSDFNVTDTDFDNFTQGGSMTLTDGNSQTGGITIEGAVTTTTRSGITLISQFIDNSGTLTANNGNINLAVAGGPIVVTDSGGQIGVQISDAVTNDISPNQVLLDNSGNISANNGDINIKIQYLSSLNTRAVRNTGNVNAVGIGYGRINQTIVLQAPTPEIPVDSPADATISDALSNDADPAADQMLTEEPTDNATALDRLIADCQSDDPADKECNRKRAIKRYLGRLLIGGSLPD